MPTTLVLSLLAVLLAGPVPTLLARAGALRRVPRSAMVLWQAVALAAVLARMAKKGLVAQQRDGRAYRYRAAASRGSMTADLMREALDEFGTPDRRTALVAFVGEASAEERAALRAALAELEGQ